MSQISTNPASSALLLTFALSLSAVPGQATPTQTPSDAWHIHGIAVNVRDPSRLFIATHHGLFLTAGDSTATQTSDNVNDFMAFAPDPADADIFFASGHPANGGNLGVIISRDGGKSWQLLSEGINGPVDFHVLTVSQANPDVMYGLFRDIQVSRDRGKNWEHAGSPPGEVFDLAASAVNADIVYAATRNGLMVSKDGAKSWEMTGAAGPATTVHTAPDGTVYAFIIGSGLVKSASFPLAWTVINDDLRDNVLEHLTVDPTNQKHLFAVTQKNQLLASVDEGKTWVPFGFRK